MWIWGTLISSYISNRWIPFNRRKKLYRKKYILNNKLANELNILLKVHSTYFRLLEIVKFECEWVNATEKVYCIETKANIHLQTLIRPNQNENCMFESCRYISVFSFYLCLIFKCLPNRMSRFEQTNVLLQFYFYIFWFYFFLFFSLAFYFWCHSILLS